MTLPICLKPLGGIIEHFAYNRGCTVLELYGDTEFTDVVIGLSGLPGHVMHRLEGPAHERYRGKMMPVAFLLGVPVYPGQRARELTIVYRDQNRRSRRRVYYTAWQDGDLKLTFLDDLEGGV